jgi:multicomponent Na+:H+ antiporter subunit E
MTVPAVLLRGAGFLALWLVLAGLNLSDLPAAVVAVIAATWVSLRLLPPGDRVISLPDLAALALRFPRQSLEAGIDVARRAFSPALPLNVGTIGYTPRLPPGPARDAFLAYASLMPGTVPVSADGGPAILVHCLDVRPAVVQQMADDEARFIRMLGGSDA